MNIQLKTVLNTVLVLALMWSFSPAYAQESSIREEAESFYKDCMSKSQYSYFHDCKCLKENYISERESFESNAPVDHIILSLGNKIKDRCVSKSGIVEFSYDYCMSNFVPFHRTASNLPQNEAKELCKCISEEIAVRYEKDPRPQRGYISSLRSQSYRSCI